MCCLAPVSAVSRHSGTIPGLKPCWAAGGGVGSRLPRQGRKPSQIRRLQVHFRGRTRRIFRPFARSKPEAHRRYTGCTRDSPVYLRCASGVHPVSFRCTRFWEPLRPGGFAEGSQAGNSVLTCKCLSLSDLRPNEASFVSNRRLARLGSSLGQQPSPGFRSQRI